MADSRLLPPMSDMEIDDAIMQGVAACDKDFAELEQAFNAMDHDSIRAAWLMLPGDAKTEIQKQMPAEYAKFEKMIGV